MEQKNGTVQLYHVWAATVNGKQIQGDSLTPVRVGQKIIMGNKLCKVTDYASYVIGGTR